MEREQANNQTALAGVPPEVEPSESLFPFSEGHGGVATARWCPEKRARITSYRYSVQYELDGVFLTARSTLFLPPMCPSTITTQYSSSPSPHPYRRQGVV
jgi:hypothetical protein